MNIRCMGCMKTFSEEFEICPYCGRIIGTPAKEANHMPPGSMLGERYTVGKVLGYGGFGVTYVGWDNLLSQPVAIKEYLPGECSTRMPGQTSVTVYSGDRAKQFQEGKHKFSDEAKRLAKVGKVEGVVKIIDTLELNDTAYIIMEYLEGETLSCRLERENTIPVDEAIKIITPVLDALEQVHKENILHRDISPDNVFLCKDGRVKLLDFGAARYAATGYSKSLSVLLKPGFAPEEQYRSRGRQGSWSDVYAVAATFYRMITGVTPEDALERMVKDTVKAPHRMNKEIPANISTAIMNGLNIYGQNRTQTARAFKEELLSVDVKRKEDKPGKRRGRTSLWLNVSGGIVIVVVFVLSAFLLRGGSGSALESGKTYIPDVINLSDKQAAEAAKSSGLQLQISEGKYNDKVERGRIISQDPSAGQVIEKGKVFSAVMSKGPKPVMVPYLIGERKKTALKRAETAGLLTKVTEKESAAQPGTVYAQSYEGGKSIPKGSKVEMTVSKGLKGLDSKKRVKLPKLTDADFSDALEAAAECGVYLKVTRFKFSSSKKNQVISQSIKAGKKIRQGTMIEIVISKGVREYIVPDVQYSTKNKAVTALKKEDINYDIKYEYNKNYKKGIVIKQSIKAGTKIEDDTVVTIYISKGKKITKITVPKVVGTSEANAIAALQAAGFRYTISTGHSDDYAEGRVYEQSHTGGTKVPKNEIITIYVSQGPEMTTVPDVTTLSKGDAISVLQSEGLRCSVTYRRDADNRNVVIFQNVSVGRRVKKGTVVTITVGK